jgi:hypothetical protein
MVVECYCVASVTKTFIRKAYKLSIVQALFETPCTNDTRDDNLEYYRNGYRYKHKAT